MTYNDDDVLWFNAHLKLARGQFILAQAHAIKVKTDMPEKNGKQLESMESVQSVERIFGKEECRVGCKT